MARLTDTSSSDRSHTVDLCEFDDLVDGEARGFDPDSQGRDQIFVVRCGDSLKAYKNECPHQGASLPWRKQAYLNRDRTHIVCSAHGAIFEIDSGKCVIGAALGQSLQPVVVSVNAAGTVQALLQADSGSGG